jgi:hypothetical protein
LLEASSAQSNFGTVAARWYGLCLDAAAELVKRDKQNLLDISKRGIVTSGGCSFTA